MKEKIIEIKQCKKCNLSFDITDKDLEFYEKISPKFNSEKYSIPTPTLCPDCRQQRRLSFRNERKLYKRKCDATGEDIISIYSPNKSYKVYNQDFWWSDGWDSMDYGVDYEFNKCFFTQFSELFSKVPKASLLNKNSQNSEYTNISAFNKDCYLLIESSRNNKCNYGYWVQESYDCIDCSFINKCTKCYYLDNCLSSYGLINSRNCINCNFSSYLENCNNCEYCFLSQNLDGKKYYIENKEYSKEEYFEKIKNIEIKKINGIKKYIKGYNYINCTGDYIIESNNCINSYHIKDSKDCKNSFHILDNTKDIYDSDTVLINSELIYESINTAISSKKDLFCNRCWTVNNSLYSYDCDNSSNLFGCIALKNKQYCILNKQYTKEEYNKLVPKIIEKMKSDGEWGEFFPVNLSSFGYNETVAQEYFPIEKDEAIKNNFNWSDYKSPAPNVKKVIPANKLPDDISDIPDDILNWAIECEETKKPFRIIKEELEFYRKHNLPIPKKHPDQRHLDRMKLRNPRKLYDRDCDKCGVIMKTTYSPDREEIVYCEKCYNKEVY